MLTTQLTARPRLFVTFALAMCLIPACDDDSGADTGGDDPTTAGDQDASCDPVGLYPAMNALINAPLAADVEVVIKQPTHPGAPGPLGLP